MIKRITQGSHRQHTISAIEKKSARLQAALVASVNERNRLSKLCHMYRQSTMRDAEIMDRQEREMKRLQEENEGLRYDLAQNAETLENVQALLEETLNQLTATAAELLEDEVLIRDYEKSLRDARLLFDLGKAGRLVLYPPLRGMLHRSRREEAV